MKSVWVVNNKFSRNMLYVCRSEEEARNMVEKAIKFRNEDYKRRGINAEGNEEDYSIWEYNFDIMNDHIFE